MTLCQRKGCTRFAFPPDELCGPCTIELYRKMMALTCIVCKAQFDFDDARVIRELIDPKANQNHETPRLCWVCAHLHHAAHQQEVIPAFT